MSRRLIVTLAVLLGLHLGQAWAGGKTSYIYTDESGIAIKGYDTVAFFLDGKPTKGVMDFKTEWNGATWYFASAEHRDLFIASPEKYAPQYGGWCAYGASRGYAAKTEPDQAWTIHDGKLYLNWDTKVSEKWKQDIPGYLQKSEANWSVIKAGLFDGTTKIFLE
jgi:YHS domain-containing protein